ncbi:unnamed protein product [Owenia fusiformis]|uniref:Uncharacterized protein n=1 Tax=Owenia fusiformis TaxID=6347 RepID=A0A8J1TJD1_OWEFU|nr:unnamed protein product [Owenia fusiformis]
MKLLMVLLILVLIGNCTCGRRRFRGNRKHKSHGSSSEEALLECEPLDAPVNGSLQLINDESCNSAVAVYSCDEGFVLNGNSTRVCSSSVNEAEWSGNEAICERLLECEPLEAPGNGSLQLINGETSNGAVAVYFCDEGFVLNGNSTRECLSSVIEAEWSGDDPICEPLLECEPLEAPGNGSLQLINGETSNGAVAVYSCNEGFVLNGNSTRVCSSSVIEAEWSGDEAICERLLECEPLETPINGFLQLINGETSNGAVAVYFCDEGFVLNGNSTRVCLSSVTEAEWSGDEPTCEPVDCGIPTRNDGFLNISYTTTTLGSIANFSCPACGRRLVDGNNITCLPSGEWSCSEASCVARAVWTTRVNRLCTDVVGGQTLLVKPVESLPDCQRICIALNQFECKSVEWGRNTQAGNNDGIALDCTLQGFDLSEPNVTTTDCRATYYSELICRP